jgi:hypothetical protein
LALNLIVFGLKQVKLIAPCYGRTLQGGCKKLGRGIAQKGRLERRKRGGVFFQVLLKFFISINIRPPNAYPLTWSTANAGKTTLLQVFYSGSLYFVNCKTVVYGIFNCIGMSPKIKNGYPIYDDPFSGCFYPKSSFLPDKKSNKPAKIF